MTDPLLSVFPAPLLRLVLCGGEGLQAAWGPLLKWYAAVGRGTQDAYVWAGGRAIRNDDDYDLAVYGFGHLTGDEAGLWVIPLDHWRARLALVAAWMLDYRDERWAWVDVRGTDGGRIGLSVEGTLIATWEAGDGRGGRALNLPPLPAHLATHDPAVALVLALWNVPEIRARVNP